MPDGGDKPKQTAFDFIKLEQVKPPNRLPSDMGKRAKQRERGRAKETAAKSKHEDEIPTTPTPEQPPQTSAKRPWPSIRGWTWIGSLTFVGTCIALFCAPQQIEGATEWYRKKFPKQNAETQQKPNALNNKVDEGPPKTTGSIDGPVEIGIPVREKTIGSAVALLGEGSYEDQTKKFEAQLKGQLILEPGWKGTVDSLTEFREETKQWCMAVRSPINSDARIQVCSSDSLAAYRQRDCIRLTGSILDFPASQRIVVRGTVRLDTGGCINSKKIDNVRPPEKQPKNFDQRNIFERLFDSPPTKPAPSQTEKPLPAQPAPLKP